MKGWDYWAVKRTRDKSAKGDFLLGREWGRQFIALKRAACRYYLDHVVPEAAGLAAQATAGAALFYSDDALFTE